MKNNLKYRQFLPESRRVVVKIGTRVIAQRTGRPDQRRLHALVDQVAASLAAHSGVGMATLAYPISDAETLFDPQVVKVVTDARGRALYFSRAPIPWHRQAFAAGQPCLPPGMTYLRHIGLYAYRAEFLQRYVAWPPAPPERAESLEQLRVLWQGEAIQVDIAAQLPGPGVDTAADLQRVRAFLGLA